MNNNSEIIIIWIWNFNEISWSSIIVQLNGHWIVQVMFTVINHCPFDDVVATVAVGVAVGAAVGVAVGVSRVQC